MDPAKNSGTRLKHHTYGEVLTTDAVLARLKEAEERKKKTRGKRKQLTEEKGSEEMETSGIEQKLEEKTIQPKRKQGRPRKEQKDESVSDEMETLEVEQEMEIEIEKCLQEVGEHVIFLYEGSHFPGKIIKVTENGAEIFAIQKSVKSWKWPTTPDLTKCPWEHIVGHIESPKCISKR